MSNFNAHQHISNPDTVQRRASRWGGGTSKDRAECGGAKKREEGTRAGKRRRGEEGRGVVQKVEEREDGESEDEEEDDDLFRLPPANNLTAKFKFAPAPPNFVGLPLRAEQTGHFLPLGVKRRVSSLSGGRGSASCTGRARTCRPPSSRGGRRECTRARRRGWGGSGRGGEGGLRSWCPVPLPGTERVSSGQQRLVQHVSVADSIGWQGTYRSRVPYAGTARASSRHGNWDCTWAVWEERSRHRAQTGLYHSIDAVLDNVEGLDWKGAGSSIQRVSTGHGVAHAQHDRGRYLGA
eukprot:3869241-Rhodomonas_salina.2